MLKVSKQKEPRVPASEAIIEAVVAREVEDFARGFARDYSPTGKKIRNIRNKSNNPFILALGEDIVIYSALMRSLDSSLGNRLQQIAQALAQESYHFSKRVSGHVPVAADAQIATLISEYLHKERTPLASDADTLFPATQAGGQTIYREHESDYHLVRRDDPKQHFLLELKIGGDLDNKKAESEKRALLEQYAILKHNVAPDARIRLYFATAYNMQGEDTEWKQERVGQFFGTDELLIGRDFWNFICDRPDGNDLVLAAYRAHAQHLREALAEIVRNARSQG
jgi:type II restriction endonuclease TdeIII